MHHDRRRDHREATTRRARRDADRGPGRPRRRWLRRLAAGRRCGALLVVGVYAWAWASLDRSSIARAMWWREADVGDQYRFPARTIPAGDERKSASGRCRDRSSAPPSGAEDDRAFDEFLRGTGTLGFVVLDDDQLVYERYFGGADRQTRQTSFSVAKSFLSTLVGIAIDEGLIGSVDRSGDRISPRTRRTGSAVRTDHAAAPALDVFGPPVRGAVAPSALGRRRRYVLRHRPA